MKRSLICMGLGAGLMYLLDPERGQERRDMLMDKLQGTLPQTQEALAAKADQVAAKAGEFASKASEMRENVDAVAAEKIEHLGDEQLGTSGQTNGSNI